MKSPRPRVEVGGLVGPEALVIWSDLRPSYFPGCVCGISCASQRRFRTWSGFLWPCWSSSRSCLTAWLSPFPLVYLPLGFPAFRTLFPEMFVRLSVGGYGCSVARLWPGLVGRFGGLRIGTVLGGSCRWLGARAIFRLLSCGTAASGVSQEVGPVLLAPGLTVYGGLGAVAAQAHGLGCRALFPVSFTIFLFLGLGAEWGPLR